jgi:hypothetical protein
MKDKLQMQLEAICHVQLWEKKQIAKEKQLVDKINILSISSVKQKLK